MLTSLKTMYIDTVNFREVFLMCIDKVMYYEIEWTANTLQLTQLKLTNNVSNACDISSIAYLMYRFL